MGTPSDERFWSPERDAMQLAGDLMKMAFKNRLNTKILFTKAEFKDHLDYFRLMARRLYGLDKEEG